MSAQSMREMMELDTELTYKVARIEEVPLGQLNGITRREWFVTNAPSVPDWFRYKAEGMPAAGEKPEPVPEQELNAAQLRELHAWQAGTSLSFDTLSPAVRDFMVRFQRIVNDNAAFYEWRMKSREQKWWAWREEFADQMMKGDHGK